MGRWTDLMKNKTLNAAVAVAMILPLGVPAAEAYSQTTRQIPFGQTVDIQGALQQQLIEAQFPKLNAPGYSTSALEKKARTYTVTPDTLKKDPLFLLEYMKYAVAMAETHLNMDVNHDNPASVQNAIDRAVEELLMTRLVWHNPAVSQAEGAASIRQVINDLNAKVLGWDFNVNWFAGESYANSAVQILPQSDFFDSLAKNVSLALPTLLDNARNFSALEDVPATALTLTGIVRQAKGILLNANGAKKAQAIFGTVKGAITQNVPASKLQEHDNFTVVIDEAAAALLDGDDDLQHVTVVATVEEMAQVSADALIEAMTSAVAEKGKATIGLATGGTQIAVYEKVIEQFRLDPTLDFSQVTTFNLDEYYGVGPETEQSFKAYMERHLFAPLRDIDPARAFQPENTHVLDGLASDPEAEIARFLGLIEAAGGLDWQLLGIGSDGHYAFLEPAMTVEGSQYSDLLNLAQTLEALTASNPLTEQALDVFSDAQRELLNGVRDFNEFALEGFSAEQIQDVAQAIQTIQHITRSHLGIFPELRAWGNGYSAEDLNALGQRLLDTQTVTLFVADATATGTVAAELDEVDQDNPPPGSPFSVFDYLNEYETATGEEIADAVVRAPSTIEHDTNTLRQLGLIEQTENGFSLTNFARRMFDQIIEILRTLPKDQRARPTATYRDEVIKPQIDELRKEDALKSRVWMYDNNPGIELSKKEGKALLGGKGYGLWVMSFIIGLFDMVPPFGTITTEVSRDFTAGNVTDDELDSYNRQIIRRLEQQTGKKFGDSSDPLLVSARSGAAVSMPGMMDTVLNIGLNDETVEGLAAKTGNRRFAFDSYRRLIQMYSSVVMGVDPDVFEHAIDAMMADRGVKEDTKLSEEDLVELVEIFKDITREKTGQEFPQDVYQQILLADKAVFESWDNDSAIAYREAKGIPHDGGTAVNIVAMVYGNMGDNSGTGVAFTRSSQDGAKGLSGDFLINAQGEDVVSGVRNVMTLEELQKLPEFADAYTQLLEAAEKLENHHLNMQDLEFTIQEGRLYLLQARDGQRSAQAAVKIAMDMFREGKITKEKAVMLVEPEKIEQLLHDRFDPQAVAEATRASGGTAASPGAASGVIALSWQKAVELRAEGKEVILVRRFTRPEDMAGFVAANAVLTQTGGPSSHAALVTRGLGKPAVVSVNDPEMLIDFEAGTVTINGVVYHEGVDAFSVDGTTGQVYEGVLPTVESTIVRNSQMSPEDQQQEMENDPEYADYVGFMDLVDQVAEEHGAMGSWANADDAHDAAIARALGAKGIGLARTEHMFFKHLSLVQRMLIGALRGMTELRDAAIAQILPLQQEVFEGLFRVMTGYPVTIRLLDPPLHEFFPDLHAPDADEQLQAMSEDSGIPVIELREMLEDLHQDNPMFGYRGARLLLSFPEIPRMQVRAIIQAAIKVQQEGGEPKPKIMVPVVTVGKEFEALRDLIHEVAAEVMAEMDETVKYDVVTMGEIARVGLQGQEVSSGVSDVSWGTNDGTQTSFGASRDDTMEALSKYIEGVKYGGADAEGVRKEIKIFKHGIFSTIHPKVAALLAMMRLAAPNLLMGVCGEHGGDPRSIYLFKGILNYVSASPFRLPVERLAAAQATLMEDDEDKLWIQETAQRLYDLQQADRAGEVETDVRDTTHSAAVSTPVEMSAAIENGHTAAEVSVANMVLQNPELKRSLQRAVLLGISDDDKGIFAQHMQAFEQTLTVQLKAMIGNPAIEQASFSLIDLPPTQLLSVSEAEKPALAADLGLTIDELNERLTRFAGEEDPMIAKRGPRLWIAWGDYGTALYAAQIQAIESAAVWLPGQSQINLPFLVEPGEVEFMLKAMGDLDPDQFRIGLGIETTAAALGAKALVETVQAAGFDAALHIDLLDFTQTNWGMGIHDAEPFIQKYLEDGILDFHPFKQIDRDALWIFALDAIRQARLADHDLRVTVSGPQLQDEATRALLSNHGVDEFVMSSDQTTEAATSKKRPTGSPEFVFKQLAAQGPQTRAAIAQAAGEAADNDKTALAESTIQPDLATLNALGLLKPRTGNGSSAVYELTEVALQHQDEINAILEAFIDEYGVTQVNRPQVNPEIRAALIERIHGIPGFTQNSVKALETDSAVVVDDRAVGNLFSRVLETAAADDLADLADDLWLPDVDEEPVSDSQVKTIAALRELVINA